MKFTHDTLPDKGMTSHPTGVRGLKLCGTRAYRFRETSHPTGVRGLKLVSAAVIEFRQ